MTFTTTDYIGYLAMAIVAASIMQSDLKKLRWLNMSGALMFVIYGFLIDSIPIWSLNIFLTGMNVYHLWKMRGIVKN